MKKVRKLTWSLAIIGVTVSFALITICPVAFAKDTVRFRTANYSAGTGKYYQEIAKAFNASQTEIEVIVEPLAWENMMQKLNSEIQSHTQPDLSIIATRWMIDFVKDDVLAQLDGLMSPEFRASFVPTFMGLQVYKGHTYALPVAASARAMFYNQDLFEKAGATVPTTWDEALVAAKKISALDESISGLGIQGAEIDMEAYWFYSLWTHGGQLFYANGKSAVGSPEAIAATKTYLKFIKAGVVQDGMTSHSRYDVERIFRSGKMGMILDGPWLRGSITKEAPDLKYGVANIPAGVKAATYGVTDSLVMFEASKVKKSAMKFLEYAFNHENRMLFNKNEGFIPVIISVIDDPFFTGDPKMKAFLDMGKVAEFVPLVPGWEEMADYIKTALQQIYLGKAAPEDALPKAAKQIDKLMSSFK
jgi:multiple sugar transport system substrate-binding protein